MLTIQLTVIFSGISNKDTGMTGNTYQLFFIILLPIMHQNFKTILTKLSRPLPKSITHRIADYINIFIT